jgi:hypothetical protein
MQKQTAYRTITLDDIISEAPIFNVLDNIAEQPVRKAETSTEVLVEVAIITCFSLASYYQCSNKSVCVEYRKVRAGSRDVA